MKLCAFERPPRSSDLRVDFDGVEPEVDAKLLACVGSVQRAHDAMGLKALSVAHDSQFDVRVVVLEPSAFVQDMVRQACGQAAGYGELVGVDLASLALLGDDVAAHKDGGNERYEVRVLPNAGVDSPQQQEDVQRPHYVAGFGVREEHLRRNGHVADDLGNGVVRIVLRDGRGDYAYLFPVQDVLQVVYNG